MLTRNILRTKSWCQVQARSMARGRNHFVTGGSNNHGISPETRDLLKNVKHAENIEEWQREPGIGDPIKFSQYRENTLDIDDETDLDMTYFPHKNEEPWPKDYEPSPVLLVKRVKHLRGEPWWHKMDCERIGLGIKKSTSTVIALPNLSFYNALLYRIKHLVEIVPVEFPDGIPSPGDFDVKCAKVTHDGKFLYHKKLRERAQALLGEGETQTDQLKVTHETYQKESKEAWNQAWNSPHGSSNYHRDYSKRNAEKSDYITDPSNKVYY